MPHIIRFGRDKNRRNLSTDGSLSHGAGSSMMLKAVSAGAKKRR